jgi:hypothetical protein
MRWVAGAQSTQQWPAQRSHAHSYTLHSSAAGASAQKASMGSFLTMALSRTSETMVNTSSMLLVPST